MYNSKKAMILLDQFHSIFTREEKSLPACSDPPQHPGVGDVTIDTAGVCKFLKFIKPGKACGPDQIPNAVLRECADTLAPALREIFERSLHTGSLSHRLAYS